MFLMFLVFFVHVYCALPLLPLDHRAWHQSALEHHSALTGSERDQEIGESAFTPQQEESALSALRTLQTIGQARFGLTAQCSQQQEQQQEQQQQEQRQQEQSTVLLRFTPQSKEEGLFFLFFLFSLFLFLVVLITAQQTELQLGNESTEQTELQISGEWYRQRFKSESEFQFAE
jgi:cell division protein FtsL